MKIAKLIIVFVLITKITAFAQVEDTRQLWEQQMDTSNSSLFVPEYLSVEADEIQDIYNRQANFGMYKDNYFITGVPTNKTINSSTADAKYQISIRQRLFKTTMPFNTQLYLTYSQKSFWNIYADSSPFSDNNYNPGILLNKPIIYQNQLKGMMVCAFEHESNGEGGLESRSLNYVTISGIYFFNAYFHMQAKFWCGSLGKENADLFAYRGYGLAAMNFRSKKDRFGASVTLNPIKNLSFNTQVEISFKLLKNENQFLFIQWYNGYGESLLHYNEYSSMIRVGMCIKPPSRSIY